MLRIYLVILILLGFTPILGVAAPEQTNTNDQHTIKSTQTSTKQKSLPIKKANVAKKTKTASKAKANKTKQAAVKQRKSATYTQSKQHQSKSVKAAQNKSKLVKKSPSRKTLAALPAEEEFDADDWEDISFERPIESKSISIAAIGSPSVLEKSSTNNQVQQLLSYAVRFLGTSYQFGGYSPATGFDCSGYVSYVYRNVAGIDLPHNAAAISRVGAHISRDQLRPGDLVFFKRFRRTVGHVGIYMGNDRFIHASSSRAGVVQISNLRERYWTRHFQGARRLAALSNDRRMVR